MYYYYCNHFMAFLSGTTWVSWYQKDKPFWILLKQRLWSGISWTICNLFVPSYWQINANNSSLKFFYRPESAGCSSYHPTNSIKALKACRGTCKSNKNLELGCEKRLRFFWYWLTRVLDKWLRNRLVLLLLFSMVLYLKTCCWCFRHDEVIEEEEVSVYDIKDHAYAKFRLGHIFVRVDSAKVRLAAFCGCLCDVVLREGL